MLAAGEKLQNEYGSLCATEWNKNRTAAVPPNMALRDGAWATLEITIFSQARCPACG